ncbi:2-dehydro-3-deoxygalactonokinase [Pontivivens ytuae]|uniref:2-dehydro-3-deoxygalactonokinase n=1 Tax=Pontivivens ytuae TaxID=2789856 RepID=A0A7S9LTX5_9RHOB|nr:2-dehydro-3-deoxygalactonokinase [Pontivivens ytuae]QPH55262.1 2-dehydro-3-deoxygalactonokinase [Pontivivens ytuae]
MDAAVTAEWIAADWGTSNLRVWAMRGREAVAEATSDAGMNTLDRDGFEGALLALIEPWLGGPVEVIACGMVGSRQGWVEAPYQPVPCAPAGRLVKAPTSDPRLTVRVLSGVLQADPPDVMRGEETQIAGLLAREPGFDGVLCLPGTHSKWARISAGELCHFRTAMTGELYQLLAKQSVLRHSVGDGWDDDAFADALEETMARPERIATALFTLRADGLLNGDAPDKARARLSGLLLGAELAAMKPYWLGERVALIGASGLTQVYAQALKSVGLDADIHDGTEMALAGLAAAREGA